MRQYRYRLLLMGLLLLSLLTACGKAAAVSEGEDTTKVMDVTDLVSAQAEADRDFRREAVREIQSYELEQLRQVQQNPVEASHFFNDLSGIVYIYFGRSDCPECDEFEPYLLDALKRRNQIVYYYDTSYWKDDPQHDRILKKYHVYAVPLLVKTVDGEYRDTYQFDPEATAEETTTQLEAFFHKNSKLFPVTEQGFPVQFHDHLFAFTFMIMCLNTCYLARKKKELAKSQTTSPLIWVVVNSTLLLALHIAIAGFGFGFAMQYEANPSTSLFAKIGTYTWLLPTPLLYFAILSLAVNIQIKRHDLARDGQ